MTNYDALRAVMNESYETWVKTPGPAPIDLVRCGEAYQVAPEPYRPERWQRVLRRWEAKHTRGVGGPDQIASSTERSEPALGQP